MTWQTPGLISNLQKLRPVFPADCATKKALLLKYNYTALYLATAMAEGQPGYGVNASATQDSIKTRVRTALGRTEN